MKTICVLSGGLDSTTLLYRLLNEGKEVYALSFDYNQKQKIELEKAKATCKKLGVKHKIIKIDFLNDITESSLTKEYLEIPEGTYEKELESTVIYNRNPVMANIALSYALTIGANEISLGIKYNGSDTIYKDCTPDALEALQKTADIWGKGIKFTAPYLYTSKFGVVKEGIELKVDYSLTYSCFKGGKKSCGKCLVCQNRRKAFEQNGILDPIDYE